MEKLDPTTEEERLVAAMPPADNTPGDVSEIEEITYDEDE